MRSLLDLGFLIAVALASPWLLYRRLTAGEGKGLRARLGAKLGKPLRGSIWLHGSSAGEVSLLRPLVEMLERDLPEAPLVISTYTSTGLAAARRSYPRHRVVLFPLDFSPVVRRFLRHFAPRLVVMVESEFWPNFLLNARRLDIPVAVINGKMSEKSCRRHAWTRLVPFVLRRLPLIAVQTDEHAQRLLRLGVPEDVVKVTGNMKYDLARPPDDPGRRDELRRSLGYEADDVVIIGGSLHEREDEAMLDAYRSIAPGTASLALILVPRYPADAARVAQAARRRGYEAVRKTALDRGECGSPGTCKVLIVDTVGELGALYAAADIAFVGGSLFYRGSNKGGHNLMEPAVLGMPVLFGPYNFSFKETAEQLTAAGGGILVADRDALGAALVELVRDAAERRRMGEKARDVVLRGQGATRRNYLLLLALLEGAGERLPAYGFDRTMPRAAGDLDSR